MPPTNNPHTEHTTTFGSHTLAAFFIAAVLFALVSMVWLFATLKRSASDDTKTQFTSEIQPLTAEEKSQILNELARQGFDAPTLPEEEKITILSQLSAQKAQAAPPEAEAAEPMSEEQKLQLLNSLKNK